ncbi:MAG: glyceraldehyde-3-phosphate dehydrogenase, partial [Pseudomonadota bacterium]
MRDACLQDWMDREAIAESMIPLIGNLYRKNNVVTALYGRPVVNRSVIDLLKAHRFVRHMEKQELSVHDTFPILKALSELDVNRAHVDLGKMAVKYRAEGNGVDVKEFVAAELKDVIGQEQPEGENGDVVLYGFGRIGRLLARILIEKSGGGKGLRLRAIVVRRGKGDDLVKRASLLRRDSIHGTFRGTLTVDHENEALIANGNYIKIIYANNPAEIDYTQYGINNALVIDNTGVWRDEDGLSQHLQAKGTERVLLTAPGKGDLKNVVYGINNNVIEASDKILSAASCTTNVTIVDAVCIVHDLQYRSDRVGSTRRRR